MKKKVSITKKTLVQRIKRKLSHTNRRLWAARGEQVQEVGEFYMVNIATGSLIGEDVDLEMLGYELKVLREWEQVEEA